MSIANDGTESIASFEVLNSKAKTLLKASVNQTLAIIRLFGELPMISL